MTDNIAQDTVESVARSIARDQIADAISEIRVQTEISERAPTKDRPNPTYGTTTSVQLILKPEVLLNEDNEDTLSDFVAMAHGRLEIGLQEEIARRLLAHEGGKIAAIGDDLVVKREEAVATKPIVAPFTTEDVLS